MWADLEPRTAEAAATRFGDWDWPHVVVETEPGDMVALPGHLMNRAQGGTLRLSWTIDYLPRRGPDPVPRYRAGTAPAARRPARRRRRLSS